MCTEDACLVIVSNNKIVLPGIAYADIETMLVGVVAVTGIVHTLEYRINGGGGGENNQGGWKWFDITIIRGVGLIGGGGCLEKQKIALS